jgi:hypothetical protein
MGSPPARRLPGSFRTHRFGLRIWKISSHLGCLLVKFHQRKQLLACPFFAPTHRADDIAFPHPSRLPLGASWRGCCSAPGHEQAIPDVTELESCNLGYATSCPRLPKERSCDAVRFSVANDSGETISLQFVLENAYLPAAYGVLHYDGTVRGWTLPHSDPRIQKLAECFLQSYLDRRDRFPL